MTKFWQAIKDEWHKRAAAYIVGAVFLVPMGLWYLASEAKITPVLARDIEPIEQQVAANSRELLWLQLSHFERIKARRPLTRRECARYLAIAKRLGVPARC